MDTHRQIDHQPTDMMHRRTFLPFHGHFLWFGTPVTIRTDSQAILSAAEEAGLVVQKGLEQEPSLRWEIVVEKHGEATAGPWECEVTRDSNSLYLSMGFQQWFAFDLETGDGAGFVVISDPDRLRDPNAESYLRVVVDNVKINLQRELQENR
jgi:hypothetical protein